MRYVALKDYINCDGGFVKTAEIVELHDDKFTAGLIEHGFIVKATTYDEIKNTALRITKFFTGLAEELCNKQSNKERGDE